MLVDTSFNTVEFAQNLADCLSNEVHDTVTTTGVAVLLIIGVHLFLFFRQPLTGMELKFVVMFFFQSSNLNPPSKEQNISDSTHS